MKVNPSRVLFKTKTAVKNSTLSNFSPTYSNLGYLYLSRTNVEVQYSSNQCLLNALQCQVFTNCQGTSIRDAISPAIFIPRGFGELGNGNLSFLGDRGNENLFPGFRVGVWGNFGEYFVSDMKIIWNFFYWKEFVLISFWNQKNNMIRNDKIVWNWQN